MKRFFLLLFTVFLVVIDKVVKYYIQKTRPNGALFFYHENYGFVGDFSAPYWLIVTVMVIFLFVLAYFFVKARGSAAVGLAIMIAGALGNLLDRLFFGFVVDYIVIWTSIFNVADVFIVLGFLIVVLFGENKKAGT